MRSFEHLFLTSDDLPSQQAAEELQTAVEQHSTESVFCILSQWLSKPEMLAASGRPHPALLTPALMTALKHARADMLSLLLALGADQEHLPIEDAAQVGLPMNFEAFLWNGWNINQALERDGPSALG